MKPHVTKVRISIMAFATLLLAIAGAAVASGHDEAKSLRDAGQIMSLEDVLSGVREEHNGRVLEAELERERGQYVYEVELLDRDGRVRKLVYDAENGELLSNRFDD